jgi:hypothetical protein
MGGAYGSEQVCGCKEGCGKIGRSRREQKSGYVGTYRHGIGDRSEQTQT